jgi:hypothetical protein
VFTYANACVKTLPETHFKHSWFQTFAMLWMLYSFFWAIPRCLNFICQCSGTLCLKTEQTQWSETPGYKIQTPRKHPKTIIHHFKHLGTKGIYIFNICYIISALLSTKAIYFIILSFPVEINTRFFISHV